MLKRLTLSWNIGPPRVFFLSTNRYQNRHEITSCAAWMNRRVFKVCSRYVDVGNLSRERIRYFLPNLQPLFLVESYTIGQIHNVSRHVDFMTAAILLGLEPGASPWINTFPGPFHSVMHRERLERAHNVRWHRGKRGWVLLAPCWD